MKMRKRFLAAFMAIAMLLTLVPFSAMAEGETAEVKLSDIDANTTVGKAVNELVKLKIINGYEDGTFRPDNTITRGEIAKIIISFMGQESVAYDTMPSGFEDVDSVNHWAKKYIKLAADQKIVNGYPDGTFMPDAPVRYTEIVKMLVCMLGYGTIAEDRTAEGSAWYSGYMAVAAEKGILKSASVNNVEDNASRGVVAILTYNCLEVETASTDSGGNITIDEGITALDKYQGKEKITGVVTGVRQTGLNTGATGLAARQITVETKEGTTTYEVPTNYDTMSILGRRISAYTEKGELGGDDKLTQITVEKTESTVVTPDMFDSVVASGLSYYPSETSTKAKKIGFDGLKVIYNGKYDASFKVKDFEDVTSGKMEFICNDGDGDAEVAFVTAYENFVVSSADKNTNPPKVYGKYGAGELIIPLDDSSCYFSLTKTGSTSEPETIIKSLSEWDVISVMRSKDDAEGKTVWNGIVTSKKASGTVKVKHSDTRKTINNTTYDYAYNFEAYEGAKPEIEVGDYVTVYLDYEGKIAAATASQTETNIYLAYLVTAEKESGVDGITQVSLFGITGTTKERILKVASPIRIDGHSYKNEEEALGKLKDAATVANAGKSGMGIGVTDYSQLIRYTTNAKGEVDMIDTVAPNKAAGDDDLKVFVAFPDASNENVKKTLRYDTGGRFVDKNNSLVVIANSSTKVLEVPRDVTDLDAYKIKSYSSAFTTNSSYQIEAFNANSAKTAKYIISYVGGEFGSATLTDQSPFMIAKEISTILNEDKEKIDQASGYVFPGGGEIKLASETEGTFKGTYFLGDIFRYATADNQVIETQQLLKFGTSKPAIYNFKTTDDITAPITLTDPVQAAAKAKEQRIFKIDDTVREDKLSVGRFIFGTVMGLDDGQISITPTIKEDTCGIQAANEEVFTIGSAKIYLFDYSASQDANKVVVDASLDNIKAYNKLAEETSTDPDEASQVLLYHGGSFTVKAIIIFRY